MTRFVKGRFTFLRSKRKGKKYDAYYTKDNKYITSFGAIRPNGVPYAQYKDKIGLYKKYDHNDKSRKDRYYARHKSAKPLSAKFFSHKFLW